MDCYRLGIEQYPYHGPCHAYRCLALPPTDSEAAEACELYLIVEPRGPFGAAVRAHMAELGSVPVGEERRSPPREIYRQR
jgi:hypothetical protein